MGNNRIPQKKRVKKNVGNVMRSQDAVDKASKVKKRWVSKGIAYVLKRQRSNKAVKRKQDSANQIRRYVGHEYCRGGSPFAG